MDFVVSLGGLCVALLVGQLLRAKVRILQRLFLPASVIGGFCALALGPYGVGLLPTALTEQWAIIPGVLISFVFAALFIGVALPSPGALVREAGPLLCFGLFLGMGQYFIAMLITLLILVPVFGSPDIFACILEIGFAGGHGTAAAMGPTLERLGFEAGAALAQMSATVGLVTAVVVGMTLIQLAAQRGYISQLPDASAIPEEKRTGLLDPDKRPVVARATVAGDVLDPLSFHLALVGIAVLIGYSITMPLRTVHPLVSGFPVFPLAMVGGLIVQFASGRFKVDHYIDRGSIERVLGLSLDLLVTAAIASLRVDLFLQNFWPFMILISAGILWVTGAVWFLSQRMLGRHWFEKGITEFGMQTGVTAVGLMLLRVVDPTYSTDAPRAFGFKQIVYSLVLGGGFLTVTAPFIIRGMGLVGAAAAAGGGMILMYVLYLAMLRFKLTS